MKQEMGKHHLPDSNSSHTYQHQGFQSMLNVARSDKHQLFVSTKLQKKCYSVCLKCWQRCQTQVIRITIEVQCLEAHMLTARTQFWKTMYWRVFGFTFWQQAQCLFEHLKSWQNCQVIHISFNIKACIRIHVLIHMCWEAPENNVLKSIWLLINTTTSKNVCLNICIGLNRIRLKSLVLALANVLEFMC